MEQVWWRLAAFGVVLLALFGVWQGIGNWLEFGRPVCDPGYAVLRVAEEAGRVAVRLDDAISRADAAKQEIGLLRAAWVAPSVALRGELLGQLSDGSYKDLKSNAEFENVIAYKNRALTRANDDVSRLTQQLYVLRQWHGDVRR